MSLTAHIVGKDLFRLRWILLLWVALVTAHMTLAEIQGMTVETWEELFHLQAWLLGCVFLPVVNVGLVFGAQNDDSVSDSDAFWITRPISAGQLLRAKVATLALLCLVPGCALLPWWLRQGFDGAELGAALLQTFAWQALFALAALPFALTSHHVTRFIMNVILAVGGAFACVMLLQFSSVGTDLSFSPGAPGRWTWAVAAIWLVATGAILLIQFFTRRTRQSLVLLSVAVAAGATVRGWWPSSPANMPAADSPIPPAAVTPALRFTSALLKDGVIQVHYEEPGAGAGGRFLLLRDVTHRLNWADDDLTIHAAPAVAAQLARAGGALARGESGSTEISVDLVLPAAARSARLLADFPRAKTTISGSVMALTPEATLRPEVGEVFRGHGRMLRVSEVIPNDPHGVLITIGESLPDPDASGWRNFGGTPATPTTTEEYFLVQREQGRAVAGAIRPVGLEQTAGGIRHRRRELLFPLRQEQFESWGGGALLVRVLVRETGTFSAVVETPRFEVKADHRSTAVSSFR